MKSLKIKKLLMALAAMLMLIAVLPLTAHGQTKSGTAKTTVTKGQSKRLTGKAVFNDTNDGNQYKYKEWTSQGIVINCTLSQDGKKVTDLTIDVDFLMNLGGLSVNNSKRISYPGTIPVINKNLSVHIDNEDCICDLQLKVLDDSANGTVDFTYKYDLGENKFKTYFGNDPISLKEKTE